ncbi:MAG: AAA family ATPase [Phycisphaerae bacterium]|jgi:CO dehydrogenase maturation factor|nr:AAA family ATPase [Phycisphaerae bacterium]
MKGSIIAFGGKGGVGKTTTAAMVLRRLIATGVKPILAVDADPNATLALTLGIEGSDTIADLRERMGEAAQSPSEISKTRLMDQWLAELLSEHTGFDLITMGRPEGPKCYCYVNGLLRRYLSLLRNNYACVLVDCEAGMEYLSRLVIDDVEALILVAEPTPIGLTTVQRMSELADSLDLNVKRRILAINKVGLPGVPASDAVKAPEIDGIDQVVQVPFDTDLAGRCARGEPVDEQAGDSAAGPIADIAALALGLQAPSA